MKMKLSVCWARQGEGKGNLAKRLTQNLACFIVGLYLTLGLTTSNLRIRFVAGVDTPGRELNCVSHTTRRKPLMWQLWCLLAICAIRCQLSNTDFCVGKLRPNRGCALIDRCGKWQYLQELYLVSLLDLKSYNVTLLIKSNWNLWLISIIIEFGYSTLPIN